MVCEGGVLIKGDARNHEVAGFQMKCHEPNSLIRLKRVLNESSKFLHMIGSIICKRKCPAFHSIQFNASPPTRENSERGHPKLKFIHIRTKKPTLGSGFILRVFLTLQEVPLLFNTPLNFVGVDA